MKRLTEENYYNLLGISPNASFEEVQSAYHEAMSTYANDSLVTYSLFTQNERGQILTRLVDAYKTLTNTQLRREYNQLLMDKGEFSPSEFHEPSYGDLAQPEAKLREVTVESLTQEKGQDHTSQIYDKNLDLFESHTSVTGEGIKAVRMAREMSIEEVYRKTNIPKQTLEDIEEENFERLPALVYLKGFLRAYADTLKVAQDQIVDGYVKRFLEWKTTVRK